MLTGFSISISPSFSALFDSVFIISYLTANYKLQSCTLYAHFVPFPIFPGGNLRQMRLDAPFQKLLFGCFSIVWPYSYMHRLFSFTPPWEWSAIMKPFQANLWKRMVEKYEASASLCFGVAFAAFEFIVKDESNNIIVIRTTKNLRLIKIIPFL